MLLSGFDPRQLYANWRDGNGTGHALILCVVLPIVVMSSWHEAYGELTVDEILSRHAKAVEMLGDFRVFVEAEVATEDGSFQRMGTVEWVRAQNSNRFTTATFVYLNSNNVFVRQEKPVHFDMSYDSSEVRTLSNSDPDEHVSLPILPGGLNARVFASKKGAIYPIDATNPPTDPVLSWLLFRPEGSMDFASLVRSADAAVVSGTEKEPLVEITRSTGKIRLAFSSEHDYLISRAEWFGVDGTAAAKVEISAFMKTEAGRSFPGASISFDRDVPKVRVRVTTSTFGTTIPRREAVVQFPEGARVDNPVDHIIHIWGAGDAPAKSFSDFTEYAKWEEEAGTRNAPGRGLSGPSLPGEKASSHRLLWYTIAIVAVLVVLFAVRRRLG